MSINRYKVDRDGFLHESDSGVLVRVCDHWKEVERLQKIIDEQIVTIKKLKPSKQHMYLVQWWFGPHDPIMTIKPYDVLQDFLNDLAENSSIENIAVCAIQPIKVTRKQVLTVEL